MDRVIEIKVGGNHMSKDNKNAGVKGEANVTMLRITFDEGWDGYAKTVTFFDAQGNNPVKRIQGVDLLEDITRDIRTYITPIPKEPLAIAGEMTFVIDGYLDGKRQRSIADKLVVKDAPITDNATEPTDPTPTQAEQLQEQIESILPDMQAERIGAETARDEARIAEQNAKASVVEAGEKVQEAQGYAEQSRGYADQSKGYAEQSQGYAEQSRGYADQSKGYQNDAKEYAEDAEVAADKAKTAITHNPIIINGYWSVWDATKEVYISTEVKAQSGSEVYVGDNPPPDADVWIDPDGEIDIFAPYIGENGNWYQWDRKTQRFVDTGVRGEGKDGEDGEDGRSPLILSDGDGVSYWYVWDATKGMYVNTKVKAQAGSTVYVGDNPPPDADVWVNPGGENCTNAPYIGENGNWYEWDAVTGTFVDSGVKSTGDDGYTPIRGTDYWTDADKAEIKAYVDDAILGGEW